MCSSCALIVKESAKAHTERRERERGRDRAIENEWAKEEKWKNNTLISVWFGILRTPNHLYPIASSISSDYNARRLRLRLIRSCMVSAKFFFICTNMAKHLFSISFANLLRNNGSYWYVLWCDVFASLFVPWWCFTISLISQQCAFSLNFTYINIIRICWSWLSCLQTSKWIEFAGVLRLNTRYVMLDGVMCMYNSWIHRGYEVFGKLMPERLCNHRHTQRLE